MFGLWASAARLHSLETQVLRLLLLLLFVLLLLLLLLLLLAFVALASLLQVFVLLPVGASLVQVLQQQQLLLLLCVSMLRLCGFS